MNAICDGNEVRYALSIPTVIIVLITNEEGGIVVVGGENIGASLLKR